MTLENKSPTTLAFKIKTTAPNTYSVRPNCSIIYPGECQSVAVHHQGFADEPNQDYVCKDKFMVLWAPVLNLSKLDELDSKQGSPRASKTVTPSPSDNSLASNRSSASSTLLALIDDISGYWRRLEEESYDVINKKKIKVLAHVFNKSHDGVHLSTVSSSATVKEAGASHNLSRRKTKRETLKDVKESYKEVKSPQSKETSPPMVTPFVAQTPASFGTHLPPRSISQGQLSAFTSPYPAQMAINPMQGSPRPEEQLLEVNQRLAILMSELDDLRRQKETTPTLPARVQSAPVSQQAPDAQAATQQPLSRSPVGQVESTPQQVQVPEAGNIFALLNNPALCFLALLCISVVVFSLNASKMGLAIGLLQTSLLGAIVYFVAQNQMQQSKKTQA